LKVFSGKKEWKIRSQAGAKLFWGPCVIGAGLKIREHQLRRKVKNFRRLLSEKKLGRGKKGKKRLLQRAPY